jgi:hypothetical protein
MASQLKVDTLTGVTTAGSIVVTGEGNSTTTNLQQGLAKAWCTAASHSAGAINGDTFNISSYSDTAAGRGRPSVTNAINNDYCVLTTPETSYPYVGFSVSTTVFEVSTVNSSGNYADGVNNAAVFGDLA